jgi:type II secretory pathway component PulF
MMPAFAYRAVDRDGRETSGRIAAGSRAQAIELVVQQGLRPVSVEGQRAAVLPVKAPPRGSRVSRASVEAFTRELANLLGAGVPLSRALSILSREASSRVAQKQWAAIHDDVVGGMPLADALSRWPRSFPPVYVAMVRAGEVGGFLDVVLGQIADFRSREQDLKGRVKAAMVYPMVLAFLATCVLTFLLTYFIPRFSAVFAEFGGTLPWLTRLIVAGSNLVVKHGPWLVVVVVLLALAFHRFRVSEAGKRALERAVLRTPGLGRVVAQFALVRFCRMLGTLLGAGVPLVSALRVAREAIGNRTLADTVTRAIEEVQRGAPLARSLAASPQLFRASITEMVAVGEESGRLDKELVHLAVTQESELDRQLRMLVALAEPALLFVMAAIIGTVVIGMLLPIFTLQDIVR